jgi:hypothetical protein
MMCPKSGTRTLSSKLPCEIEAGSWCTPVVSSALKPQAYLYAVKMYVQDGIFQYKNVVNVKNLLGRIFSFLTDYVEFM